MAHDADNKCSPTRPALARPCRLTRARRHALSTVGHQLLKVSATGAVTLFISASVLAGVTGPAIASSAQGRIGTTSSLLTPHVDPARAPRASSGDPDVPQHVTPTSGSDDSPRCSTAAALLAAGQPRDAAELVDKIRQTGKTPKPDNCTNVGNAIRRTFDQAAKKLDKAQNSADKLSDPPQTQADVSSWKAVKTLAQQAAALDTEDKRAEDLLTQADSALTKTTLSTRTHDRAKAWTDLLKDASKDLGTLATTAVATLALIALIARLLLLLPPMQGKEDQAGKRWVVPGRWSRGAIPMALANAALVVAVLLGGPAAAGVQIWPLGKGKVHVLPVLGVVALALLGLVAVFLTWGWLFHRLRVRIDMQQRGESAKAGAAAVVAHLRSLGAAPPRGLEVPLGTDADTLSGSNITSSVKGVLATFVGVLQSALSITPWRVLVDTVTVPAPAATAGAQSTGASSDDEKKDEEKNATIEATIVMVSRHGRVIDSALIMPTHGAGGPRIDVSRFVAARSLRTILAANQTTEGLGGATDWQSIALQYEATTGEHDEAEKKLLLASAVKRDPNNWAARMSYRMSLYSTSTDPDTLAGLTNWLLAAAKELKEGEEALKARMLYAAYATVLNHKMVTLQLQKAGKPTGTLAIPDHSTIGPRLIDLIDNKDLNPTFAANIRRAYSALTQPAPHAPNEFDPGRSSTGSELEWLLMDPNMAYSWACWNALALAENPDHEVAKKNTSDAITFLRYARADETLRGQADNDQSLGGLRKTPEYRAEFGTEPDGDILAAPPFNAFKAALTKAGLTEPAAIAATGSWRLRSLLDIKYSEAKNLVRTARLYTQVGDDLTNYRVGIIAALAKHGIVDQGGLRGLKTNKATGVRETVLDDSVQSGYPDPDSAALNRLLHLP